MSAARIDHVGRATQSVKAIGKTLEHVVPSGRGGLTNDERIRLAAVHASEAQAEATLALVEQQRIANLQAERRDLRARAIGRTDDRAMEHRQTASLLDVEIREALGLS